MQKIILTNRELEALKPDERVSYYSHLKQHCLNINSRQRKFSFLRPVANIVSSTIRNYDFKVIGTENIPNDGKALFVVNHSNSHDFYTMQEAFCNIGIEQTFMASNEGLSSFVLTAFQACNGVLFDRSDKDSANLAFIDFVTKIVKGMPGVIFAESTWNLHPYKPMHLIKTGAANIAAIAEVPIIPTIFEYVEVPERCKKESNLYSQCIVKFNKAINISRIDNMITQTDIVQQTLENSRLELWKQLGIQRKSIKDIDQEVYLNHTYLKKFGAGRLFEYDSTIETQYLLIKDRLSGENEYHLDAKGDFVPGILTKEEGKKYI